MNSLSDMAVNLRPSVFERILEPSSNASPHSLQLELHFRATQDGTRFMIILNNMKLMCSFDWLIRVNEFIMTKAENPFLTGKVLYLEFCHLLIIFANSLDPDQD